MNGEWLIYDPTDPEFTWREAMPYGWHKTLDACTHFFDDEVQALGQFDASDRLKAVTLDEARQIETLRCL